MSYFALPFAPALSLAGAVAPSAKLYFYLTGTTTLAAIYADEDLTTPLSNPVIANSAGRFADIYLDDAVVYRVRLETSSGALIEEADPANASALAVLKAADSVAINRDTALSPLHVGGKIQTDNYFVLPNGVVIAQGASSPEGGFAAEPGSLYLTPSATYRKGSGSGTTGWVAI